MRKAAKILGAVVRGVVIAAALGAAVVLVLPRLLGWQSVTVMSGSMAPTYAVDAELALAPVDPADVRVGDVIAFRTESDRPMVTHRVAAIYRDAVGLSFVTKGDANEEADIEPVAASAVRGRVVFGVPHLGLFVRGVRAPFGFLALVVLPGLLLIGQELRNIRRERRTRQPSESLSPPVETSADSERFDFWTTEATEERYAAELDREVSTWRSCGL